MGDGEKPAGRTTICVRELPDSVTRREFRNLVALLPGYEDCSVTGGISTQKPAVAFAKFSDASSAESALRALTGYVYDEDFPHRTLLVDIARRDLEIRPRSARPPPRPAMPQFQGGGMPPPHRNSMPMGPPPGMNYGAPPPYHQPSPSMYHGGGPPPYSHGGPLPLYDSGRGAKRSRYDVGADTTSGDTICFLKLPRGATESMILDLVGSLPGYMTLNYVSQGSTGPVAFALFQDGRRAQDAIDRLQGQSICDQAVNVQVARRSLRQDGPAGSAGSERPRELSAGADNGERGPKTCRRMETERIY